MIKNNKLKQILHILGMILIILSILLILPLLWSLIGQENTTIIKSYLLTIGIGLTIGILFYKYFEVSNMINISTGMLLCAFGWLGASLLAALPFIIGGYMSFLDAFFETVSGFTTTGITLLSNIGKLPPSLLFWRSLIQWLGGLGILTFFLLITFRTESGIWKLFTAETHKISSSRPVPNLARTVKILWSIYFILTFSLFVILNLLGTGVYDALLHSLTTLSTGGFSPHDASIAYYNQAGFSNYRLIEYTFIVFMFFGGTNFLIFYKFKQKDISGILGNPEYKFYIKLILIFLFLIFLAVNINLGWSRELAQLEERFRNVLFQIISLLTTTGYETHYIGSNFFPAAARQLFLIIMLIGGSVGSTAGGLKVFRILILYKLFGREMKSLNQPRRAVNPLVIAKTIVPWKEVYRVAGIFFAWLLIILMGGIITALLSEHGALESISGMFSAVNNIGPSYLTVPEMIELHPIIKITYIIGMLAGRLELLPIIAILNFKMWKK